MNYFEALGIDEQLAIDPKILESSFYTLSRKWHPDRFARASAADQQRALDFSALLNDAYRTLREPVGRAEYVLELHQIAAGDTKQVPPELLEEVFELNMALEEVKFGDADALGQLQEARVRFRAMLDAENAALQIDFERWDGSHQNAVLESIRTRLNRRKYISNLVRDTEKALESNVSN